MSKKNQNTLLILSFYLGMSGVDRMYAGYTMLAILKMITFGGLGIWWLIDFIMAYAGKYKDSEGNYITK